MPTNERHSNGVSPSNGIAGLVVLGGLVAGVGGLLIGAVGALERDLGTAATGALAAAVAFGLLANAVLRS